MDGTLYFLIVDDSATLRKMIAAAIQPLKAHISEASNGLEAIEQLSLHHYDVITLDLNMPDMHGLELLHFVRNHSHLRDIPILVITTRSDPESREAAIAAGANLYLNKPFQPAEVLQGIKTLLG
jgi:two-component system, chemotaxis family, chemotaxis protein CheY